MILNSVKRQIQECKDKKKQEELKSQIPDLLQRQNEGEYYSDEELQYILKQDIYALGILILECIQEISDHKRKNELDNETMSDMIEICKDVYSPFFVNLLMRMIDTDPVKRIGLGEIRDYLKDIYSRSDENNVFVPE